MTVSELVAGRLWSKRKRHRAIPTAADAALRRPGSRMQAGIVDGSVGSTASGGHALCSETSGRRLQGLPGAGADLDRDVPPSVQVRVARGRCRTMRRTERTTSTSSLSRSHVTWARAQAVRAARAGSAPRWAAAAPRRRRPDATPPRERRRVRPRRHGVAIDILPAPEYVWKTSPVFHRTTDVIEGACRHLVWRPKRVDQCPLAPGSSWKILKLRARRASQAFRCVLKLPLRENTSAPRPAICAARIALPVSDPSPPRSPPRLPPIN